MLSTPSTPQASPDGRRSPTPVLFVTVILAAAVAQGFGRFTFGVVLPDVRDDLLDGSNTVAGLLGSSNTFAYLAGTLAVAALGTRLAPMQIFRAGTLLSVSGLALAVVAPNGLTLAAALVMMGFAGAMIWIPTPGMAAAAVSEARRGLAVGTMGLGVGVGVVWSGQLKDIVADQDRTWRSVYGAHTVVGIVVIVLVFLLIRGHGQTKSAPSGFGGFSVLSQMHGWRALTGCYFAFGFGYLLVIAFLVARLEDDNGFSSGEASRVFVVLGLSTVFGGLAIGRVSDIFGRRRTLIVGYLAFAGCALLLLTGETLWLMIGAVGCGLLFGGIPTAITAYIVDRTDATTYGPSYAAATFAFGVAQVAAPQAGGAIADWRGSFSLVFVLSAIVMTGGAISASLLPKGS